MSDGGDAHSKPRPSAGTQQAAAQQAVVPVGSHGASQRPPSDGVPHAASHLSGGPPPPEPEMDDDGDSSPPSIPSAASLRDGAILSVPSEPVRQELTPLGMPA